MSQLIYFLTSSLFEICFLWRFPKGKEKPFIRFRKKPHFTFSNGCAQRVAFGSDSCNIVGGTRRPRRPSVTLTTMSEVTAEPWQQSPRRQSPSPISHSAHLKWRHQVTATDNNDGGRPPYLPISLLYSPISPFTIVPLYSSVPFPPLP